MDSHAPVPRIMFDANCRGGTPEGEDAYYLLFDQTWDELAAFGEGTHVILYDLFGEFEIDAVLRLSDLDDPVRWSDGRRAWIGVRSSEVPVRYLDLPG